MISVDKIIEIFCIIDDFCIEFSKAKSGHVLSEQTDKKRRNRSFTLSDSEVITILILFHAGLFRNLKHFYLHYVNQHLRKEFPRLVSYNRFVELQQKATMPIAIFLKIFCLGQCTGISFVDSTPLKVCRIRREHSNKVFNRLATKGQCSIGWFFGFKLHLIINDRGEILDFIITQENINNTGNHLNRSPYMNKFLVNSLVIKNTSTKHYSNSFFIDGIHLITKLRKNMKNCLMHIHDKILLKERAIILSSV